MKGGRERDRQREGGDGDGGERHGEERHTDRLTETVKERGKRQEYMYKT